MPERYVAFKGLKLYVREQGEGRPLLLINGLGGNTQMWRVAQRRLSKIARTIAFDAPGTGRSRLSPVPLPLPVLARAIGRMLDELGYDEVDVAGYSLGGVIAQQFARTLPHRVRRMALVGTACGWGMAPPEPEPLALISSPLRYFSKRVYRATNHIVDGGDRFKDPRLREAQAIARSAAPPNPIGYAQQFLKGTTWSSLHWARTVHVPTLVLSGASDRLVPPANGLLLARALPQSRLHTLSGEGHLMLFDPESAAYPLLESFFGAADHTRADAWTSGREIIDDGEVDAALEGARGTPIVKPLAAFYRGVARSDAAAAYWSRSTRL
jgi:pimeloyl-ACP methyl ester carboxylesterase